MRIPTIAAGCLLAALGVAGAAGRAQAASELVEAVQVHLYAGETAAAAAAAEQRSSPRMPTDDEARFALGAVQFLQAIENLGPGVPSLRLEQRRSVRCRASPVFRSFACRFRQIPARKRSTTRPCGMSSAASSTISRRQRRRFRRSTARRSISRSISAWSGSTSTATEQGSDEEALGQILDCDRHRARCRERRPDPDRLRCERRPLVPRLLPPAHGDRRVSARA